MCTGALSGRRILEADSDLRCMINNLNYELIDTMADEGFYPERSIMNEENINNPEGLTVSSTD